MGAPKMTDNTIEHAVRLLDGWSGKLTWDAYLDALTLKINHRYTKAAMLRHQRIKISWNIAKLRVQDQLKPNAEKSLESELTEIKIKVLQDATERLTRENNQLLEQFVRWAHNAASRGLTPYDLDKELPMINRKPIK